jgi:diphthamide biosynthesis protein 7
MLQHPSSTTTIHLDQPPSCLQFCPASPNNFVVGTYLLSETKTTDTDGSETIQQSKSGSLQLWHLDPETDALYLLPFIPSSLILNLDDQK